MRALSRLLPLVLGFFAAALPAAAPRRTGPAFPYLEARGARVATRNAIPLRVTARGFRATPASNRDATFGGHPYQVSLVALLSPQAAIMVHAERVADASGASNYDDLPPAGWPDARFRVRTMCAVIDQATIAEEHDLSFLRSNGWNPAGALAVTQYLATTTDHNQEVVLSLVVHVASCEDVAANQALFQRLRDRLRVSARR